MASTVLADIDFNSNYYTSIMEGAYNHRLAMLTSGVLGEVPENILSSQTKGEFANIPMFDTLSGDSVQITTSSSTTVNNLASFNSVSAWVNREKAWGADQIIKVVSGQDVAEEIMRQIGEYWANEVHKNMIVCLGGSMATALASTHSTGATYAGATINLDGGIAAKQLLGDNQDQLKAVFWNSKVGSDALKDKIVDVLKYSDGSTMGYDSGIVNVFLGATAYQTDKLTATASVYPTYFAAPGTLVYKFREFSSSTQTNSNVTNVSAGGLKIQVEKHRVALTAGGQDVLISRASFLTHVMGTAWDVSISNPTNAQLATGSNWSKTATDDKYIKVAELKTL